MGAPPPPGLHMGGVVRIRQSGRGRNPSVHLGAAARRSGSRDAVVDLSCHRHCHATNGQGLARLCSDGPSQQRHCVLANFHRTAGDRRIARLHPQGSMPFFTVLIAGLLLADEKFSTRKIIGIVIGFAGVVLIIGPRHLLGMGDHLLSELMLIGAAVSYAFASVWGRRFAGENPMATATGQLTMSTLMMIPIASLINQPWALPMPSLATIGSVIALAVICTAFAYVLFFRILDMAGATNVSLVTMLVPVSATLLAVPLLDERLEWLTILGFVIITLGLMVLDGRPVQYVRDRLERG